MSYSQRSCHVVVMADVGGNVASRVRCPVLILNVHRMDRPPSSVSIRRPGGPVSYVDSRGRYQCCAKGVCGDGRRRGRHEFLGGHGRIGQVDLCVSGRVAPRRATHRPRSLGRLVLRLVDRQLPRDGPTADLVAQAGRSAGRLRDGWHLRGGAQSQHLGCRPWVLLALRAGRAATATTKFLAALDPSRRLPKLKGKQPLP